MNMKRVLTFTDEWAPIWTDPTTGERKKWTMAEFIAAGFDVREIGEDMYAVDLDSRPNADVQPQS